MSTGSSLTVAIVRTLVRWLAHSGQRMPTEVVVMQSGQIGRPQFEQLHAGLAVGMAVAHLHAGGHIRQSAARPLGRARAARGPRA